MTRITIETLDSELDLTEDLPRTMTAPHLVFTAPPRLCRAARGLPRAARPLRHAARGAALVALALLAVGINVTALRANQVVILTSGNRIEVESAHPVGDDGYYFTLVGGGTLRLPASAVRRVSHMASDMPKPSAPMIASTSGTWQPSGDTAGKSPGIPAGIPPQAIKRGPGRLEMGDIVVPGRLGGPGADPGSYTPPPPGVFGSSAVLPQGGSVAGQAQVGSVSTNPLLGNFRRVGGGAGAGVGRASGRASAYDPGRDIGGPDLGRAGGLPRLGK